MFLISLYSFASLFVFDLHFMPSHGKPSYLVIRCLRVEAKHFTKQTWFLQDYKSVVERRQSLIYFIFLMGG